MTELGAALDQAIASWLLKASPAKQLHLRVGKALFFRTPSLCMKIPIDGTEYQNVSLFRLMNDAGLISWFREGTQSVAPDAQARNISQTDGSNVSSKF